MTEILSQVQDAWQTHDTKSELRAQLRKLFDTHVPITDEQVQDAFNRSPYIGDSPKHINPRPTKSGLRDALPVEVLTMCLCDTADANVDQVLEAIGTGRCEANPSPKSKTGVYFGWPDHVSVSAWNAWATGFELFTKTETSMEDMSLDELVSSYAILTELCSEEDVKAVFNETLGRSKAEGVFAMMDMNPTPDRANWDQVKEHPQHLKMVDALDDDVETEVETKAEGAYELPEADKSKLIDMCLDQAGLPNIEVLINEINAKTGEIAKLKSAPKMALAPETSTTTTTGDEALPSGSVAVKEAWEVFGIKGAAKKNFMFDVPVWSWDSVHPHVPQIDANYQFQPQPLMRVLYSIITNQRCYLHGHTGSGKTTLVEQVAARLNYPFMRLNFDSEITRMDLIGRDILTQEEGTTTSAFVDGILPQMMQGPYIGCFDEIDFVRPDVSYVMQRVFEGNGLLITEDGGRVVKPHRMFRMFATGNTVGQGDEFGMYQGARPQSIALLDRFTVWSHIDYMPKHARKKLIAANASRLEEADLDKIDAYVAEHLNAFKEGKVLQPISPRGFIALGQAVMAFYTFYPAGDEAKAFQQAFETTILDRATVQDKVVLNGIAQRVFA